MQDQTREDMKLLLGKEGKEFIVMGDLNIESTDKNLQTLGSKLNVNHVTKADRFSTADGIFSESHFDFSIEPTLSEIKTEKIGYQKNFGF